MPRREAPRDEKNATSKIGREAPRDDHREKKHFFNIFSCFQHVFNMPRREAPRDTDSLSIFRCQSKYRCRREAPRDDSKDPLKSVARRLATIQNKKIKKMFSIYESRYDNSFMNMPRREAPRNQNKIKKR